MPLRAHQALFVGLLTAVTVGALLRGSWLTSDPPTHAATGIVWHDEGPWVHNARNRALWGTWRTDEWNPVFLTPVFTALEYVSFEAFGVGTWQARMVPVVSGLAAVLLIGLGLAAASGLRAGLIGALLLATNYVFVMWNRAALMESTMTAFIVASWTAYVLAQRRPALGLLSGAAVVLAWFTKASAAFFVAALLFEAIFTIAIGRSSRLRRWLTVDAPARPAQLAAWWTLAGVAIATAIVALCFVLPFWSEYRFYNWQMSVTRKPAYTVKALMDRASWLPIAHDFFTRMWLVMTIAALGIATVLARWRTAAAGERLLVLWVLVGLAELVVHDSGNERRYVMFIPALVGLAALVLSSPGPLVAGDPPVNRWIALPVLLLLSYLVIGSIVRLAFLYEIRPGGQAQRGHGRRAILAHRLAVASDDRLADDSAHQPPGGNCPDGTRHRGRSGPVRPMAAPPVDVELRGERRSGPCVTAGDPGAGQAGQRTCARESYTPGIHRTGVRQLRGPEAA